jgi:glycolate dehydrogenase FAD-binding subunit
VSAIAERVREAYAAGTPLRIRGAGTWLGAGRPARGEETLSLAEDRGIVEYVPGDLTLTARAGTPLADIVAATGAHGQWLPLDPWGGDAGTLGATISTATAGPHSYAMGLPRDVVLGVEFVSGTGAVIRAGGRVVKNVAGFDLTRLLVGSWGTLGVITEVTVRLRARPDRTQTLGISVSTEPLALNELALRLRALPFTLLASEVVSATLASHLGAGSASTLLCRIGGNEASLKGQTDLLRAIGKLQVFPEEMWQQLRTLESATSAAWRFSKLPTLFGETWRAAEHSTRELSGAFVHGNPARGVARVVARGEPAMLARAAGAFDGTIAIESLPRDAWPLVRSRGGAAGDVVSRAIREKFDPRGILNAGILGEDE